MYLDFQCSTGGGGGVCGCGCGCGCGGGGCGSSSSFQEEVNYKNLISPKNYYWKLLQKQRDGQITGVRAFLQHTL